MDSQSITEQLPEIATQEEAAEEEADGKNGEEFQSPDLPPTSTARFLSGLTPFWHDRLIEVALVASLALYYIVGNANLGPGRLFQLNPIFSLPFLVAFVMFCWYRLPFAIALIPLSLPYYLQQKTVISHYSFSITEIALMACTEVALTQFLIQRREWRYSLSWRELLDRIGPFAIPIIVFVLTAGISVIIAYSHRVALRAFREEVFEPVLYLFLAMYCLRVRQDVMRLLLAMFISGFVVALLGIAQYTLFKNQLVLESDGIRRVHAMYGSANNIGLFFDYALPIGLALILIRVWSRESGRRSKWWLLAIGAICLAMVFVLYLSQSRGAWVAIGLAGIFIIALSLRNRKQWLISGLISIVLLSVVLFLFHKPIYSIFIAGHQNIYGISTLTKRLFLWLSALRMIRDHLWFGVGLENWLCYYSQNPVCVDPTLLNHHYWILQSPFTGTPTGLGDEPTLSHPHNIFLHVWVSIGVFGLLAFISVLVLFFWLFARILKTLHNKSVGRNTPLWWMTIGVGAAMLAGLIQGQVDSSFLAQDLSFCFWMLVTALLLLRVFSGTPWRRSLSHT